MVGTSAGGPTIGLALAAAGTLALPVESFRIAARSSRNGHPLLLALADGGLSVLAHFAHIVGQYRYLMNRASVAQTRTAADNASAAARSTAVTLATDTDWQADKERYPRSAWITDRSIWAIAVYRFGRRVETRSTDTVRTLLEYTHTAAYWGVQLLTGIDLPKTAQIGPGIRILRAGDLFGHPNAKIGAHVTLSRGATVGTPGDTNDGPTLEDGVELGPYAQIVGDVRVGSDAVVTAMSVVLGNVAARVTVAGNPAKCVLKPRRSTGTTGSATKPSAGTGKTRRRKTAETSTTKTTAAGPKRAARKSRSTASSVDTASN
jgi:serine O-acetyltransferase